MKKTAGTEEIQATPTTQKTKICSKDSPESSCCRGKTLLTKAQKCLSHLWTADTAPRDRIMAAAKDLFYREGLHAVGVDVIAAAADTNKMTLYRHFGSKDELIAEYLRDMSEEGLDYWDELEKQHPGDPMKQLLEWIQYAGTDNERDVHRGCAFINAAAELPDPKHPGRLVIESYKSKFRDKIVDVCRLANLTEPERLADELQLIFEGAIVSAQNFGPHGPAKHFVNLTLLVIASHQPNKT